VSYALYALVVVPLSVVTHLSMHNDLNLSIYRCRSESGNPQTYFSEYYLPIAVPYNMTTTDSTIDRVEFRDVTAHWCDL